MRSGRAVLLSGTLLWAAGAAFGQVQSRPVLGAALPVGSGPAAQLPLLPLIDPQAAVARDAQAEALGALVTQEALPLFESEIRSRAVVEFYKKSPILVALAQATQKFDRVQPGQAALFDQVFARIDINRDILGFSDAELSSLRTDPVRRAQAAQKLAPILLHEMKHHQTRGEVGDIALRENELEAYHVQSLFLLSRIAEDQAYLTCLPGAMRGRYERLLRSWLGGPKELARFVAAAYGKVPSVFNDRQAMRRALEGELSVWRDRLEHHERYRQELIERAQTARSLEGSLDIIGAGGAAAFQRAVENYPVKEAVEHAVLKLSDALVFWENPQRVEKNRRYYFEAWRRIQEDWAAWSRAHPDFQILPPRAPLSRRAWAWARAFGRRSPPPSRGNG